jgi:integrase
MSDPLSLPFAKWPELHKKMWLEITEPRWLDPRPTVHWGVRTRAQARQSYGRWLKSREQKGLLDCSAPPTSLIVRERVSEFIIEEMQRIKLRSVGNFLFHLIGVAKSAAPGEDWSWLLEMRHDLKKRARREPRASRRIVSVKAFYKLGLCLMSEARKREAEDIIEVETYLHGLLIAVLACEVQRSSAFSALELGVHIERGPSRWRVKFDAEMTKTKQMEIGTLPGSLTPLIDFYVERLRPRLVSGLDVHQSKRFWIGPDGRPLSANKIRNIIKFRTRQAFGFEICPHSFRHAALTTFTLNQPQFAAYGADLLGDSDRVANEHYLIPHRELALEFVHKLLDGQSDQKTEYPPIASDPPQSVATVSHSELQTQSEIS